MNDLFDPTILEHWYAGLRTFLEQEVLVWSNLFQALAVLAALALAELAARPIRVAIGRVKTRPWFTGWVERGLLEAEEQSLALAWLAIQWVLLVLSSGTPWGGALIGITFSLLAAWVVIQFGAALIHNPTIRRTVAYLVWTVAALSVLGWLKPLVKLLDTPAVYLGGFRLTPMVALKGIALFAVLMWLALLISRTIERRVKASRTLTPSIQVLTTQFSKILLVTLAVVFSLSAVGVDLTAFAVFTGALGVGIGFGLQKLVSNLLSGVLLLLDRSIKPGDVIAVGQTYGWVNYMGARYVSVITRDGIEHLIPNENLIANQVENWSHSNNLLRLKVPIGISYNADVHKAKELILEAAAEVPRVLENPVPVCLLAGFGDSSVDFDARIWINDPQNGVSNVKSELLFLVWDKFHEHGIEIPFPQRDLHIRSPGAIRIVRTETEED